MHMKQSQTPLHLLSFAMAMFKKSGISGKITFFWYSNVQDGVADNKSVCEQHKQQDGTVSKTSKPTELLSSRWSSSKYGPVESSPFTLRHVRGGGDANAQ